MSGGLDVRRCGTGDAALPVLVRHHVQAPLDWDPSWQISPQAAQTTLALITRQLGEGTGLVLLAEHGQALVGALWAFDPTTVNGWSGPAGGLHIGSLWVAPPERGRGIASRLVTELEVHARAHHAAPLTSEVHRGNPRSQAIHDRWGFRSTGTTGEWIKYTKNI